MVFIEKLGELPEFEKSIQLFSMVSAIFVLSQIRGSVTDAPRATRTSYSKETSGQFINRHVQTEMHSLCV
jgi:hypothetical protein